MANKLVKTMDYCIEICYILNRWCNRIILFAYNIIARNSKKLVNPAIKLELEKGGVEL